METNLLDSLLDAALQRALSARGAPDAWDF